MATILAPWINTSIVIHRTDGYLSVTLQVPEPLSRNSEVMGLCSTGCPSGFELSQEAVVLNDYPCSQDKIHTSIMCLILDTPSDHSGQYGTMCSYDLLQTHDLSILSLYNALYNDTRLLPDVTEIITTLPPTMTTPSISETTPTPKIEQVTSIMVATPPEGIGLTDGVIDSQTIHTAHPLSLSLSLLVVALSLLWLR